MKPEQDNDLDLDLDEKVDGASDKADKKPAGKKNGKKESKPEEEDAPKKKDAKEFLKVSPYKTELDPGSYPATHHLPATDTKAAVKGKPGMYVNQHGIAFPAGFKFKGGHVSSMGNVVLVKCPECHNRLGSTEALKGFCDNRECNYSAVDTLDEITEDDLE